MPLFTLPFEEAVSTEDGNVQILQMTARVWTVERDSVEIPTWHKYNLIPNSESGIDAFTEQIWVLKSLVFDAACGHPSEMAKLYDSTLYNIYELITLRRAAEWNN